MEQKFYQPKNHGWNDFTEIIPTFSSSYKQLSLQIILCEKPASQGIEESSPLIMICSVGFNYCSVLPHRCSRSNLKSQMLLNAKPIA